jgi:hypothetical protein
MPKDACYKKVKARYRVFPSAYASGAIAKCRKVGAANYGNKSKKEIMKDKFKPHMMYCKNGKDYKANTYKQHLALKKKGCGHSKVKK